MATTSGRSHPGTSAGDSCCCAHLPQPGRLIIFRADRVLFAQIARGTKRATGHALHAGLRAKQQRRPWKINRCETMVRSLRGNSASRAYSMRNRIGLRGPSQPPRKPGHGVHGESPLVERVAPHDMRGLAPHSGQSRQRRHGPRDLSVVLLADAGSHRLQRCGLVAEEPVERMICSRSARSAAASDWIRIPLEQGRRHLADPLVGALRAGGSWPPAIRTRRGNRSSQCASG